MPRTTTWRWRGCTGPRASTRRPWTGTGAGSTRAGGRDGERAAGAHGARQRPVLRGALRRRGSGAARPSPVRRRPGMLLARTESHRGNVDEAVRLYLGVAEQARARERHPGAVPGRQRAPRPRRFGPRPDALPAGRRRHPGTATMGLSLMRLEAWPSWRRTTPRRPAVGAVSARATRAATLWLQATYWSGRAHEATGRRGRRPLRYQPCGSGSGTRTTRSGPASGWTFRSGPLPWASSPGTRPPRPVVAGLDGRDRPAPGGRIPGRSVGGGGPDRGGRRARTGPRATPWPRRWPSGATPSGPSGSGTGWGRPSRIVACCGSSTPSPTGRSSPRRPGTGTSTRSWWRR
jgi:hypothetical protein